MGLFKRGIKFGVGASATCSQQVWKYQIGFKWKTKTSTSVPDEHAGKGSFDFEGWFCAISGTVPCLDPRTRVLIQLAQMLKGAAPKKKQVTNEKFFQAGCN